MKIKQMLFFLFMAATAAAQMPHQVAVLVNDNSQASKKAANIFAALHGVPGENMIYLDLPESMFSGRYECSPEEFKTVIYDPAVETLVERGLDEQVSAIVYSVDFPIRIITSPNDRQQMSIMGLTFFKGAVPDLAAVEQGKILSPLFSGPASVGGPKLPSRSFEIWRAGLKEKMPLPSMMLGYIGPNGSSLETVLRCVTDGVKARRRKEAPKVLLVKTDDKARSAPRDWQFDAVGSELETYGATALVVSNSALRQDNLLGVMTGAETVSPAEFGTFAPGAMADHLTSWSAEFQKSQTKCTAWLDAGATVTAGMVTEPYNNWVKFPHARFFSHYALGCTAMESFYQSLASPVQVLLLGDPLSQIRAMPVQIRPLGLSKEITDDIDAGFMIQAQFPVQAKPVYSALLNGKEIMRGEVSNVVELPFDELGDGCHIVRLIAQAPGPTLPGGFVDVPVFVNKKGRSVEITDMGDRDPFDIIIKAETKGPDAPESLYVLWNGCRLAAAAPGEELVFDERVVGEGPQRIQVVAVYADGMEVHSKPQAFAIEFNPEDAL